MAAPTLHHQKQQQNKKGHKHKHKKLESKLFFDWLLHVVQAVVGRVKKNCTYIKSPGAENGTIQYNINGSVDTNFISLRGAEKKSFVSQMNEFIGAC